jgi:hypothetical protein
MSSVTNSSGLNYQNGVNPLGRKVRALEADVATLKNELSLLKAAAAKAFNQGPTATAVEVPATLTADLESLKKDMAAIKSAGFGKGEKGDKGDNGEKGEKGDKGDKGDTGPMTYIAMPQGIMPATTVA